MSTTQQTRMPGWNARPFSPLTAYTGQAPPTWREEAACRQFPTDLFFPIGHGPRAEAQAAQAKTICNQCPVQAECLDYALTTNAQFGVFGGMSEDERRRARRNLARQAARASAAALEAESA